VQRGVAVAATAAATTAELGREAVKKEVEIHMSHVQQMRRRRKAAGRHLSLQRSWMACWVLGWEREVGQELKTWV
jgi:hypothetical protein